MPQSGQAELRSRRRNRFCQEPCLLSSDSSQRLRKETEREASFGGRDIPVAVLDSTSEEIGHAAGLRSAVLAVNDEGFARTMLGLLNTSGEVNQ